MGNCYHKPIENDKKQDSTKEKGLSNKEPIKQLTEERKIDHSLTNGQDVKVRKSQKQFFLASNTLKNLQKIALIFCPNLI